MVLSVMHQAPTLITCQEFKQEEKEEENGEEPTTEQATISTNATNQNVSINYQPPQHTSLVFNVNRTRSCASRN